MGSPGFWGWGLKARLWLICLMKKIRLGRPFCQVRCLFIVITSDFNFKSRPFQLTNKMLLLDNRSSWHDSEGIGRGLKSFYRLISLCCRGRLDIWNRFLLQTISLEGCHEKTCMGFRAFDCCNILYFPIPGQGSCTGTQKDIEYRGI